MDKTEYSEFINHPLWREKREDVFRFYGKKCSKCGSTKFPHVHHKTYTRGKMPWEYPIENFIVLCERCHKASHGYEYTQNRCNVCGKEIPEKFKLCIDCHNKTVGKMERDRKTEAQRIESQISSLRKLIVSAVVVIVALAAFFGLRSILSEKNPGGHLLSPTYGHLFFPHPLCHLAGMKKRRDQCIQVFIHHPGLKSDSWVGDFGVATGGGF